MRRRLGLLAICLCLGTVSAQDFLHLDLEIQRWDTLQGGIEAQVRHRLTAPPADSPVFLNGIAMDYQKVRWNGRRVRYLAVDTGLWVYPKNKRIQDTNALEIHYRAYPKKGLYFIGFEDSSGRARRQIWTQGQGIDHRHWIPHRDDQRDKISFAIKMRFAADYQVMINGRLLEFRPEGAQNYWHYAIEQPMSSYLIAIAIGRYDSLQLESGSGTPIINYFYPERAADYRWYYYGQQAIFDFLEADIGMAYPWPNYKQAPVRDFRHGAMENTSATIFGDFFLVDSLAFPDQNYSFVNAHELAHQWFGNLITAPNSRHHWLHEGFATYYQWRSEGHLYGWEHYHWERSKAAQMIFEASQQDDFPLAHPKAGSVRFYQKGAWLLHQLRARVGDSIFRAAVLDLLQNNAFGLVHNRLCRETFEKHCQCDLKAFFRYWLEDPAVGKVHIRPQADGRWRFSLEGELQLAVQWEFWGDSTQEQSWPAGLRDTVFSFDCPKGSPYWRWANLDDHLVQLEINQPDSLWRAQVEHGQASFYQIQIALAALQSASAENRRLLKAVIENREAFGPLRSVALQRYLSLQPEGPELRDIWRQAARSKDIQLALAALNSRQNPAWAPFSLLDSLSRHGASYRIRLAALQASLQSPNGRSRERLYDSIWAAQPGFPEAQIYLPILLYRAILFGDGEALATLLDYSGVSFPFQQRMAALSYLKLIHRPEAPFVSAYLSAWRSSNWKLRRSARENLLDLYHKDQAAMEAHLQALALSAVEAERLKAIFEAL